MQGEVKNSIGNGVAKELMCVTNRHGLSGGIAGWNGVPGIGGQRRKNWDNSNSIITKIYTFNIKKLSGPQVAKLLKTKREVKSSQEKMTHKVQGNNNWINGRFVIINYGSQKRIKHHLSSN